LKAVSKEMQLDCIGTGSDLRLFDSGGIAVKKEKKRKEKKRKKPFYRGE